MPNDSAFAQVAAEAVASGVPGVQLYVRRGGFEWQCASGLSSVERNLAMTLDDRVRVASITKMLTYATVMELERRGRLRLTDRAVDHLPPATLDGIPYASEITIAQLLDHTSGLHNFNGEDGSDFFTALFYDAGRGSRRWTPQQLIVFARSHPPTGRPGEKRSYSSTGYMVLQLILEHVEKTALSEIYRRYLFTPLEMRRSATEGFDISSDSIVPSYAIPSSRDRGSPSPFGNRRAAREDGLVNLSDSLGSYNAWAGAAGAVATTVKDLARFMDAVRSNRRTVLSGQVAEFSRLARRPDGTLSWNGGSWGIQATILYEPGRDITVIVLSNASNAGLEAPAIARRLLAVARTLP
jgi:D-alanyl-D-alanine carboxypeptidase